MSKVKLLTITVVAMLVLNLTLIAFLALGKAGGEPHRDSRDIRPEDRPRAIVIERLKLDDLQVKAYDGLIQRHRAAIREKEEMVRALKTSLYLSLRKGNGLPDKAKDSIISKLGALQQSVEWVHYHHFEDIRGLCRADQLPAFESLSSDLAKIFSRPPHPPRGQRPPGM